MLRRSLARVFLLVFLWLATPAFAQQASTRIAPTTPQSISPLDAIALVLRSQGYYIAPILQNEISPADIQAAADAANNQFKVQIVLLEKLPKGFSAATIAKKFDEDAARLAGNSSSSFFDAKTPLVIVIAGNQIAARGSGLPPEELDAICERAARVIDGATYRAGLTQIVSTSAYLITQRQMRLWQMGGVALLVLIAGIVALSRRSSARRKNKHRADELIDSVDEELVT